MIDFAAMAVTQVPPEFVDEPTDSFAPDLASEAPTFGSPLLPNHLVSHDAPVGANMSADMLKDSAPKLLADMIDLSRRDVERYPESAWARVNLAIALIKQGQIQEAESHLQQALRLQPGHLVALSNLARIRTLSGDFDDARRILMTLEESRPGDVGPLLELAKIAAYRENWDEAIRLLKRATTIAPDATMPQLNLGVAFLHRGLHQEAIQSLRAAVRADARLAFGHFGLGQAYVGIGNHVKALNAFKTALTLDPAMVSAIYELCRVLLSLGRFREVANVLPEHLRQMPQDVRGRELLAWALIKQDRVRDAKAQLFQAFHAALQIGSSDDDMRARLANNLGVCYWLLKQRDEANKMFATSIGLTPASDATPYHNLARLLLEEGQNAKAQGVLDACVAHFPNQENTKLLMAVSLEALRRHDEAIAELQHLIESETASAAAYGMLGVLLIDSKGKPDQGLPMLERAVHLAPVDALAINNLAYAYLMLGRVEEARRVLSKLPDRVSGLAQIVVPATKGLLGLKLGDFNAGRAGYKLAEQIALAQGKFDWVPLIQQKAHLELARAFLVSEDFAAARREVKKGLSKVASDIYQRDLSKLAMSLGMSSA